jgi:UDP-N-acetylmuramate--alanine ligase
MNQFAEAFGEADHALIVPIYRPSGREREVESVSSRDLVTAITAHGHLDARFEDGLDVARETLMAGVAPGDAVVVMGAGDVTRLADDLNAELARRTTA